MKEKPRIGTDTSSDKITVYNADYAPSGTRIGHFERPWTTIGRDVFAMHATHTEAIQYAVGQATPADPTPQEQESVTKGWTPAPDPAVAWQEKQELTR